MSDRLDGWLVIDKPAGMTSTAVLNEIKKIIQAKQNKTKVGHAGTLDPFATGILMVALGEATKTVEFAMDSAKAYEFTITWGENRDTLDIEGKVMATSGKMPSESEINSILNSFVGNISQIPPQYSAIKVDGKRAYALARMGIEVAIKSRQVFCSALSLKQFNAREAKFRVDCGKGFYVRALARDIAEKLGVYGYVSELRRVRSGKFTESDTISLDKLKEILYTPSHVVGLMGLLKPVSAVLDGILVQQVNPEEAQKLKFGQKINCFGANQDVILVICEGKEVAIAKLQDGFIIPTKVFNLN